MLEFLATVITVGAILIGSFVFRRNRPVRADPLNLRVNPFADTHHYYQARLLSISPTRYWYLADEELKALLIPARVPVEEPTTLPLEPPVLMPSIYFGPNEPRRFSEFLGQEHIVRPLAAELAALPPTARVIDHHVFTGVPGQGKTLLAKVVANEINLRAERLGLAPVAFFETFAVDLNSIEAFDAVVRNLVREQGGVWFIDEIHVLDEELATKLYPLLQDGRYSFHGEPRTTLVPDVVVLGATTDPGRLHGALKRRFGEPFRLRQATREQLLQIISERDVPIAPEAALQIVSYTHWSGAPWETIQLYDDARKYARARQSSTIELEDVAKVAEDYELDEMGLRWLDREVLTVLFRNPRWRGRGEKREFVCYALPERDLCAAVGLDPDEYHDSVKARLRARNLLEVKASYGQALTESAIRLYQERCGGAEGKEIPSRAVVPPDSQPY